MIKNIDIKYNEKLSKYSTIKIGGQAKIMAFPKNLKELRSCLRFVEEKREKVFVLGNGSNTLFDDSGFDGVVVNMKNFDKVKLYRKGVYAGGGIKLFILNQLLAQNGYTGLEWSYGIPGSLGGFVFMNGGSFEHDISEFVEYVEVLQQGKFLRIQREDINFSYRHSGVDGIILGIKLKLGRDKTEKIKERMEDYIQRKKRLQPYDALSLGSVFKRTMLQNEVLIPAKMIDSLGLKGVKIGGAEVSRKHAGFIVNDGRATAEDVKKLVSFLSTKLKEIGVDVETEIIILEK